MHKTTRGNAKWYCFEGAGAGAGAGTAASTFLVLKGKDYWTGLVQLITTFLCFGSNFLLL